MAGEVVERSARRRDVDQPEEGGAELGVLGGALEGAGVERPDRMARARGERLGQSGADGAQLGLDGRLARKLGGSCLGHL